MDFHILRELICLKDAKSYLDAAEELFISQSTLSKHIKSMEQELGVKLVNSAGQSKVTLTPIGEQFLIYAQRIIDIQDQYMTELINPNKTMLDRIVIGSIPSQPEYNINELIMKFQHKYPQYQVTTIEDSHYHLVEKMKQNKFDFVFTRDHIVETISNYRKMVFLHDSIAVALPRDHRFADAPFVTLDQLANEPCILTMPTSYTCVVLNEIFKSTGFEPQIKYQVSSPTTILDYVRKKLGISIFFKASLINLSKNHSDIKIVDISPVIHRNIVLYYPLNIHSTIAASFLRFVQNDIRLRYPAK